MADLGYREVAPWGGRPRWKCDSCAYDGLVEATVGAHVAQYHRIKCDGPNCEFVAADAWEMQMHAAREHQTTIIVTDAYGREQ